MNQNKLRTVRINVDNNMEVFREDNIEQNNVYAREIRGSFGGNETLSDQDAEKKIVQKMHSTYCVYHRSHLVYSESLLMYRVSVSCNLI